MTKARIILSIVFLFQLAAPGIAQTQSEMITWLKKNIHVYYVQNPYVVKNGIQPVTTDKIAAARNGIIFGQSENNSMNISAQVLLALFKGTPADGRTAIVKSENGDPEFQKAVYQAMQIAKKPVSLYFFNDVETKILTTNPPDYTIYVSDGMQGQTFVYPSVSKMGDNGAEAAIILGENLFALQRRMQEMILNLVVRAELGDFGPAKGLRFVTYDKIPYGFVMHDIRHTVSQGIANAFTFAYSSAMRQEVNDWDNAGGYFFLPDLSAITTEEQKKRDMIPAEFDLNNAILRIDSRQRTYSASTYAGKIPDAILKSYLIRSDHMFMAMGDPETFKFLNDIHIGMMCYQFIRKFGVMKFVEALRFNSSEVIKAAYDLKLSTLFKNMALVMLNGKAMETVKNDPKDPDGAKAMFSLAIFHWYGFKFPKPGTERTPPDYYSAAFMKKTGMGTRDLPQPLLLLLDYYYHNYQERVKTVIDKATPDQPGFTRLESKINEIYDALGIK